MHEELGRKGPPELQETELRQGTELQRGRGRARRAQIEWKGES